MSEGIDAALATMSRAMREGKPWYDFLGVRYVRVEVAGVSCYIPTEGWNGPTFQIWVDGVLRDVGGAVPA